MRQMQSDRVLALLRSSAKVEAEIETHTPEIALRLEERFTPRFLSLEDGSMPDFLGFLTALKNELSDSREEVSSTERRNIDLLRDVIKLRLERTELVGGLYEDFSNLRRTIEQMYEGVSGGAFVLAGFQGPTAEMPEKLLRQIEYAVSHLLDPALVLPAPRNDGFAADPRRLAQNLQPRVTRLRELLGEIRRVTSALNATRKKKNRAIQRHKATFLWVARSAEALFQLAGEPELAERIRPSVRRPGRRAAEVEPEPPIDEPTTGDPPVEDPPDEPPDGESDSDRTVVVAPEDPPLEDGSPVTITEAEDPSATDVDPAS